MDLTDSMHLGGHFGCAGDGWLVEARRQGTCHEVTSQALCSDAQCCSS